MSWSRGFDREQILSPHEIERRLHEQTDLHWVQTELAKQGQMTTWQLGTHLASNLDAAVRLLEEKLDLIRALDTQILTSTELAQEMEKASMLLSDKAYCRIRALLYPL